MKVTIVALIATIFSVLAISPVHAQQNVSCNDSNYQTGNTYKVKVPGTSGTTSLRMTFLFAAGSMRINIKNGTTSIATINYTTPGTFTDDRDVPAGSTISYEFLIVKTNGTTAAPGRWMPVNVAPNSAKCGTGCPNGQGGYFALVSLTAMQAKAVAGGYKYVDLSTTYTLFKMADRTKNSVDTAVACINDQVGGNQAGTLDDDFNDMVMMWTYKGNEVAATIPTVGTNPVQNVTKSSAKLMGKVYKDGGSPITQRGFVYSKTAATPTLQNATKIVVPGDVLIGGFEKILTGLQDNTKYYVRAFGTNAKGTGYGEVRSFTTKDMPATAPVVETKTPATEIAPTSAKVAGEVMSDGGSVVTERGFVYSKTQTAPTLANASKAAVTGTTGDYSAKLSGLSADSKYYFRAYAKNAIGTSYGAVYSFTSGHKPTDTGFEDNVLLYLGGALYAIGVVTFMGARVLSTDKKQARR